MKKSLKILNTILLSLGLLFVPAMVVFAVQITVPSAPGANYLLESTTTGNYLASTSLVVKGTALIASTTLAAVASSSAYTSSGDGNYTGGDQIIYDFYTFKTVNGVKYFSQTFSRKVFVVVANGDGVVPEWNLVPNVDGYRIVRTVNSGAQGYIDCFSNGSCVNNSASGMGYIADFAIAWASSPVLTPTSIPLLSAQNGFVYSYATSTAPVFVADSTTASSTFANGINLSGGCFQINGSCMVNGVLPAGSLGNIQFSNGSGGFGASNNLFWSTTKNAVGIGTSSPFWGLTIVGTAPTTGTLGLSDPTAATNQKHWVQSSIGGSLYIGTSSDVFGTSTPSALTLANGGNVGIATSSPGTLFSIGRTVNFTISTTTFSSTGGLNLTGGCYSLNGLCIGVNAGTAGQAAYYASAGSVVSGTSTIFISNGSAVGIGTTSPAWNLQVAGSKPSITLSDTSATADQKHWLISIQGGNLYFATATDALGTTSTAAIVIQGNSGGSNPVRGTTYGTSSEGQIQQIKSIVSYGLDPLAGTASSTLDFSGKTQFDVIDAGGAGRCAFWDTNGAFVSVVGRCPNR